MVGRYFFNIYFVLMMFVQIPMLHFAIVSQENKEQVSNRGRAESWVARDYNAVLED